MKTMAEEVILCQGETNGKYGGPRSYYICRKVSICAFGLLFKMMLIFEAVTISQVAGDVCSTWPTERDAATCFHY